MFAIPASPHISFSLLFLLLSVPAVRCSCTSLVPLLIESGFPLIPDWYDVSLKFIYIYITKCSLVTVRYIRLVIIINYFSYSTVKCSKVRVKCKYMYSLNLYNLFWSLTVHLSVKNVYTNISLTVHLSVKNVYTNISLTGHLSVKNVIYIYLSLTVHLSVKNVIYILYIYPWLFIYQWKMSYILV